MKPSAVFSFCRPKRIPPFAPAETSRQGMTLVELLAVITVLVILLSVSVPMFRPLLDTRRTRNAAEVLATAFQTARSRAIAEGRSYGLKLVPYETASNAAIQLKIYRQGNGTVNSSDERVVVINGTIKTATWDEEHHYYTIENSAPADFAAGYKVQFNRVGRLFELATANTLKSPYDSLTLPDGLTLVTIDGETTSTSALEYWFAPPAAAALSPPVIMPKGTVVDLEFCGGRGEDNQGQFPLQFSGIGSGVTSGVTIMFSPSGYVKEVLLNDEMSTVLPNEPLYFCVGEWDRQNGTAEDGKSNLESPNSFWVTLHPKTGTVHIAENAPVTKTSVTPIQDARKYATEYYVNVGGN